MSSKAGNKSPAVGRGKPPVEHQFKRGNSGKPKGARNKLCEGFLHDVYKDWQANGIAVIEKVRTEKPDQYLKVVASLLPKDINLTTDEFEGSTTAELLDKIRKLDAIIEPLIAADEDSEPFEPLVSTTH